MKKTVIIAVLGLAASVASSYAQGFIAFNSYVANAGAGATTSFSFGSSGFVPGSFTAELFFALGTVSDPVTQSSATSVLTPPTGFTAIPSSIVNFDASGDGYFQGGTVTIPGYTSGAVSFQVVATGVVNGVTWYGRSGSFTESTIANSASAPLTSFGDNGTGLPSFVVAPVPEPTTLALAGLGGLASLVALRRKQS